MINQILSEKVRILAIAPSTRGFGFAVLEDEEILVDWGAPTVEGDKNAQTLKKIEKLLALYHPDVVVLEDALAKGSRRQIRIKRLCEDVVSLCSGSKKRVVLLARPKIRGMFFTSGLGTKQAVAETLAEQFREELHSLLPPRREAWMSEDHHMPVFEAVAIAIAFQRREDVNPL